MWTQIGMVAVVALGVVAIIWAGIWSIGKIVDLTSPSTSDVIDEIISMRLRASTLEGLARDTKDPTARDLLLHRARTLRNGAQEFGTRHGVL